MDQVTLKQRPVIMDKLAGRMIRFPRIFVVRGLFYLLEANDRTCLQVIDFIWPFPPDVPFN
jgi:hypothetical protein